MLHTCEQSCEELTSGTGSHLYTTAAAHAMMLDVANDQSPGRSVNSQADNDVKTLPNHFSILDSSSTSGPTLSLGRCLVQGCCSNMVHCPFCDRLQYKPTQPARVRDHLYLSHFQHAVYFEGWMMVKCFHKCRDPDPRGGHYHCPSCSTTLLKRNAFTQHLISHAKKQGLDPKTVHAPDAKQPAVIHFEGHKILLCREKCSETLSAHYHCPLCRQTSMRLASLTSHLWRCKKQAIAVKKGDESEETTSMAELFSPEMVASVTHPRDLPQLKWHLSIVRNLSDLPLTRCFKPACCKGRYHCPLCTTSKLKPNYLCHMRQHFVSHWRTGVPYEDYTVLVCYLSCEVPHRVPRPRFHYHCPLCGDTRRRKEAFARHLVNCDPSRPQPVGAQVIGSRSDDDDEEEELPNHAGTAGTLIQLANMQNASVDQVEVQGAGEQSVGADQAKLQAAESLADMDRISVQSMGHSCMSRLLKQLNGQGDGICETARTGGPPELHQCSDLMMPSEKRGYCVLSEKDVPDGAFKATSQNIAKKMQYEQTPVEERLVSLQNNEAIQISPGENASSVMSECEQRGRVTLLHAHHKEQVDSLLTPNIEINVVLHEEQRDLQPSPEIDAGVSHEASGNGLHGREEHTSEVTVPFSPCIASKDGGHRAEEILTAESMESSSQEPGIMYPTLNLLPGDRKEAESKKEALTSMQVDDDNDIQVFKQVTTQVAQTTVSRLECLGELEASLQVIEKLCGVTWQQSGCTITMSSCLESLCHAEECLKQIVKGGLQAFLQASSETSTNIQPLPSGGKTFPRKRGRPRGSKNKHTVLRTEEYTPLHKQSKILALSSEKLESHLSGVTTTTPSGMYASRTRGKHINFALLHAGSLSPPPSPSQDEQPASTQRQEQEGKKRRGRPRKILIQAEDRSEVFPSEGKGADVDNMKQREIERGGQGLQLCGSEEKFSRSCIPSGQHAPRDGAGYQHPKGVQSNRSDHHQQETMNEFNVETTLFCTPNTASVEGCALESRKFSNAVTSLLQVVTDNNETYGCDAIEQTMTVNKEEISQTEKQTNHNGVNKHTLTEAENGVRSKGPCSQLLPATPDIKREQYKTRTKSNDFVFIPSIVFTYSKDDTLHDSLGGQNEMEEMEDNIVSETEDITLEGSFAAEKAHGNIISAGWTKQSGENTLRKIASSEMCNAVNKDNVSSEEKDIARNQNASCPGLIESSEKPQKRDVVETSGKVSPHHLPCPLCIIIASTYSQMCDHLAKQHPSSPHLTCEVCELVCITPSALAFHVERKHGPQLYPMSSLSAHTCFCGKVCGSITSLKWHQSFVHKQVDSHRRGFMRLTCGLCSYKASDSWDMRHHRELHRGRPNTCPVCHKKLSSEAAVKVHMAAIHSNSKFSCHICSKTFAHIRYLKSHVRRHGGEKRHECGICGWRFHETNTLRAHLDTHKPREQRTYSFTCPYCPAAYNNRANLRDHLNKHTGDKPHICRLCNKGFAFRSMLTTHHAFVHSSERPHSCQLCPKKFKTKMQLQQHMVIHTGTSNHTCQKCGRAMPTASRLRVHARRCKGSNVSKQLVFQAQSTAVNIVTPSQTVNIFQKANLGQGSRLSVIPGHNVHLVQAGTGQAQTLTLVPIHQLLPGTTDTAQKRVVLVSSKGQAEVPGAQIGSRETMSKSDHINTTYIDVGDATVQMMGSKLADSVRSTENSMNSLQQLPDPERSHQGSSFLTINRVGLQSHQAISRRCDSSLIERSAQEDFNSQVSGTSVLTGLQASDKDDNTTTPLVISESHIISANHADVVGVSTEGVSKAAEDKKASDITLSNSGSISVDNNSMNSTADVHQAEMQALVLPSDLLNQEVFIIEGDGSQHLISLGNIQFVSAEEGEHQQKTGFISHLDHTVSSADHTVSIVDNSMPCAAGSLSSQDDSGHNTLDAGQLLTEDEDNEEVGKMTLFMCSMCDQTFADQASAEQHVMVQHEVEVDNT